MHMVKLSCLNLTHVRGLEISEGSQGEFLNVMGIGNRVPTKSSECGSNRIKADMDS